VILLERIFSDDGTLIAIIVLPDFEKNGVNFLSEKDFPLQLGVSHYPKSSKIDAHIHLSREILINSIQEVVHIELGCVLVDFFDHFGKFIKSVKLPMGSTVLFISGGHGFTMIEDTRLVEIKQGPYLGKEKDKVIIDESGKFR
jgi:hypothetical protein